MTLFLVHFEEFDNEDGSVLEDKVLAVTTSINKANELANGYIRARFFNYPDITGEWKDQTINYLNERISFYDGPYHCTVTVEETETDELTCFASAEVNSALFDE